MSWAGTKTFNFSDVILQMDAGKKIRVRPLFGMFGLPDEPITILIHSVATAVKDGSQIRNFSSQLCRYEFDPQGVCRSGLCGKKDPLWNLLSEHDKYYKNKEGKITSEKHFSVSRQHFMPVYVYELKGVRFVRQGNTLFQALAAHAEAVGMDRDFMIWKEQTGSDKQTGTKYYATPMDKTDFVPDVPITKEMINWNGALKLELPASQPAIWNYAIGMSPDGKAPYGESVGVEIKYLGGIKFEVGMPTPQITSNVSQAEAPPTQTAPPVQTAAPAQVETPPAQTTAAPIEPSEPEPPDEPETVADVPKALPTTIEQALDVIYDPAGTSVKKHKGDMIRVIAANPKYLQWIASNIRDPRDAYIRTAAMMVFDAIQKGQLNVLETPAVTPAEPTPTQQPADDLSNLSLRDRCVKKLEQIFASDQNGLASMLEKYGKQSELKVTDWYNIDKYTPEMLNSLDQELSSKMA